MGTITARTRRDGSVAYLAQILIKRNKEIVHRENRTFDREAAARAWIKQREKTAKAEGGLEKLKSENPTLKIAIERYIKESRKEIGRTKASVLSIIAESDIGAKRCDAITSTDIYEYGAELRKTVKPQTVGNYMSHLAAVYAIARPAWGIPLDQKAMEDAQLVMKRMGVVSKSAQRDRRPSMEELDRLLTYFGEIRARRPKTSPMQLIVLFAIFSTRRQEEITRIAWKDLDEDHSRILVRDMKHPGQKVGNDMWCELPAEALSIIKAMPRKGEMIFPYEPIAISASFTRACKFLTIEDLHFHDLRHEGISRLFEMGLNIPQAAAVSGHRSWNSLQRYTHVRQKGDKYEDWKWLMKLTNVSRSA